MMPGQAPDSGSFRDREGRVYLCGDRVIRGLSETALEHFRALQDARFYRRFTESGAIIGSRELGPDEVPLPRETAGQWAGFVEHERVPVVSYPYEWTFGMLRDAALLQLELLEAALQENFTLKDATPYNIQFVERRAVFIDLPSFEPLSPGEPWTGYRQFCEMFLFPLMLQAYKGVDFHPFLRGGIDGVDVQAMNGLFGLRDRLRRGVLGNVWLQAKLDRRFGGSDRDVRSSLKAAGFNKELILANVRKLRKLVRRLEWREAASEWGDYTSFHNYSAEDHQQKEAFIEHCVREARPATVWDIGANTGQFARVAAERCRQVVATDIDHLAVERMYRDTGLPANVLPLVQNVADPSPNWGWRNLERRDLRYRSEPDMVLCLALLHHVVITANIPLAEFVEWLAGITPELVIEFVSREDDKVRALLRNKEDRYWDYRQEYLEAQLGRHFEVRERKPLRDGLRQLYWCSRRA
jgi:hypothetical protein